ncbi:hypothetical protein [Streptomyces sp. G-5]|uniref:hypothetical protein n=1 Tax=Streptomyces sp. G-5 TaxID=2977231 RepID=UPI0021D0D44F|nr:hypothetical protein [Streptomyces sp. G-5]MCU4749911.1 hypothetical protein [Streptomyces sp. G-5]
MDRSAVEASPWRAGMRVPEPEVTVYTPGRAPLLRVLWEGTQPVYSVIARQDLADGCTAYQVEVSTASG